MSLDPRVDGPTVVLMKKDQYGVDQGIGKLSCGGGPIL